MNKNDHDKASKKAAHESEVTKITEHVQNSKRQMIRCFNNTLGVGVLSDAKVRAFNTPGLLGKIWLEFIALSDEKKIDALSGETFCNMQWQSLLQSNPFFRMISR